MISTRMQPQQVSYLIRRINASSGSSRFVVSNQIADSSTTTTCRRNQLRSSSVLAASSSSSSVCSSLGSARFSKFDHHCSFSTRNRNIRGGHLPLRMNPTMATVTPTRKTRTHTCSSRYDNYSSFSSSSNSDATMRSASGSDSDGSNEKTELVVRDLFLSYAKPKDSFTGDGDTTPVLRVKDLHDLLSTIGERPSNDTLREIVKEVDANGDGLIDMEEFLNGCNKILAHSSSSSTVYTDYEHEELAQMFRTIDRDGNGVLTLDELEGLLSTAGAKFRMNPKEAQEIFTLADTDNDGEIDFSEFMAFVTDPARSQYSWRLRSGFRGLLVVGGPGSGKGLLCEKLVAHAGIKHYSSGEVLRAEVESHSALGDSIAEVMQRGDLVPATTMIALLKKHVRRFPGALLALDGFPRTPENYHDFHDICGPPECAIYIDVPDEVMIERILMRATKEKRADDNVETAQKRIETFHKFAEPTLDCIYKAGITVHKIDGTATPETVWKDVLDASDIIRQRVK